MTIEKEQKEAMGFAFFVEVVVTMFSLSIETIVHFSR